MLSYSVLDWNDQESVSPKSSAKYTSICDLATLLRVNQLALIKLASDEKWFQGSSAIF